VNSSIPVFTPRHDNGALSGYGLMNQPCQRFSGGPAVPPDIKHDPCPAQQPAGARCPVLMVPAGQVMVQRTIRRISP
jgi:hypothetical protein